MAAPDHENGCRRLELDRYGVGHVCAEGALQARDSLLFVSRQTLDFQCFTAHKSPSLPSWVQEPYFYA